MKIIKRIVSFFSKKLTNNLKTTFNTPVSSGTLSVKDNVISGYIVCQSGDAKGHELYVDVEFLEQIVVAGNVNSNGVPTHFGHPENDTEALCNIVGYSKNFILDGNTVRADLHLLNTAEKKDFIEELATKMPTHFGASIMFTRDVNSEIAYVESNEGTAELITTEDSKQLIAKDFTSPDKNNANNFPHARLYLLAAVDIVHTPATTESFFKSEETEEELTVMDKPEKVDEMTRYKSLKARYADRPDFLIAQFEKGNTVEQAEVELMAVKIKEQEKEITDLKAKLSVGPTPPNHVSESQSKPDFLAEAKALVASGRFSKLYQACAYLASKK